MTRDVFVATPSVLACAHPPLTPKKSGRWRLCVFVVNRVPSHMTFTWIRRKDADCLERGWGYVQDGRTNQVAALNKYRKSPVAEHS